MASMGARLATGEEVKNTPMPLVDRFTAKVPDGYDAGAFRRSKEMIDTLYKEYELYPERRKEILKDNPGLMKAHAVTSAITQEVRRLRADQALMERPTSGIKEEQRIKHLNRMKDKERELYTRGVSEIMKAGPDLRNQVMDSD